MVIFFILYDIFLLSAVRFGRVPKKEKARIIEQMQKSNLQMVATAMSSALSAQDLVQAVKLAHSQTCDIGPEKAKVMREIALLKNDYVDCPAHMVRFVGHLFFHVAKNL